MLRKGYIQQQLEGLALALSKLLGLGGDRGELLREIGLSCKELTGLEMDTLLGVSDATLLGLFSGGDKTRRAGNAFVAAQLLMEHARVERGAARGALRKALMLYAEALALEPSLRTPEHVARFERLRTGLPDADKPAMVRRQLARAQEALGHFARAEDEWYGLRDSGAEHAESDTRAFYVRLLALTDEEIEAGGLTREEILTAFNEIS